MVRRRIFLCAACLLMHWGSAQGSTPDREATLGTIQLRYSDPADVAVRLSGPEDFAQEVQVTGGQIFSGLQPGTYVLEASKEGYRNFSETLEVVAGTTTSTMVTLEQEASDQVLADPGILQLTWVDPSAVTVSVRGPDGYAQETTVTGGQVFSGLAAGSYEVSGSKEGYRSTSQIVEVTANQTESLSIILEPQPGQSQANTTEAAVEPAPAAEATPATGLSEADLLEQGAALYIQAGCSGCHGGAGGGNQGPAFVGNEDLAEADFVANILISGNGGMPSFGARLSDEEIASLATFIRNSWGNNYGAVSAAEVAEER